MKRKGRVRAMSEAAFFLAMMAWLGAAWNSGPRAEQIEPCCALAPGGQEGATVQGPLAGLPSKPGPHIDRIKALADNSWLELGPPLSDPRWGRARGRSWTAAMPLAPELRGAFLSGEGQHGYTKPDGHYMDDLWFYDINAHRWICCYPGAPAKTLRLTLNSDGFEATAAGDVVPVAQQVHGYQMNTYVAEKQRRDR